MWQKVYEYEGYDKNEFHAIQQTSDGGYIVRGSSWSFGAAGVVSYLVKLNNTGGISWQTLYAGGSIGLPASIQQTSEGGI